MPTQTQTAVKPKQDQSAQEKIQELRELFADAPEVGKKALENVLKELSSQVADTPPQPVISAGRVGSRLGMLSELTILVPFALGVSFINAGEGPPYTGVFEFALAAIVFDGRFGRFNGCHGLCDLRRIVIILKRNQKVPFVNLLEVGDVYIPHNPSDFRTQRRNVAAHEGVVGDLFNSAALPGIPVPCNRHDYCSRQE